MDLLKRSWLVFARRWPVLLACIALAVTGVGVFYALYPKEYTASTDLFLRAPEIKSSASAYQGNLFTLQRANSYVNLVESDTLAQTIIDQLGLDTTPQDLAAQVSAEPIKDTVMITISVTDSDAEQAANIANAYGKEFSNYVSKIEAVAVKPDLPPLVSTVRVATAETAASNLYALWISASVAAGGGLLIGLLLMWLLEHYDTKIRSRRQIEETTGARVIGTVPPTSQLNSADSVDDVFETVPKFADAARSIAINADYALREVTKVNGAPVLAIASVHDGDGKSVVARAMTRSLSDRGYKVGLLRVSSTGEVKTENGNKAARGRAHREDPTLKIETLSPRDGAFSDQAVRVAIDHLSTDSDFIIVDGDGSGGSAQTQLIAAQSDGAVVVVRPGVTDVEGLTELVSAFSMLNTPVVGIVANQAKETNTAGRYFA